MKNRRFIILIFAITCNIFFLMWGKTENIVINKSDIHTILEGNVTNFDLSKTDPEIIYAIPSTNVIQGELFISADAGKTWASAGAESLMESVVIDEKNPRTAYTTPGG